MIIALDFDGTVVEHEYPEIGDPVPLALDWLHWFQSQGARIILWTMRSGEKLDAAARYLAQNDVQLWALNHNPEQASWTSSPKCYAHVMVDDTAAGTPVIYPGAGRRPYVDWEQVGPAVALKLMEMS